MEGGHDARVPYVWPSEWQQNKCLINICSLDLGKQKKIWQTIYLIKVIHKTPLKTAMFCPHSAFGAGKTRKRRAEAGFPGTWAPGEAAGRPTGRSLVAKIIDDDPSFQWDLLRMQQIWIGLRLQGMSTLWLSISRWHRGLLGWPE